EAVTKTKKILSANMEAQLSVECLMEDEDFGSTINREVFLEMCQPMMDRVTAVLESAKAAAAAAGITTE
ncbi:HSP70-14, partial [Symbiodinium pilosum]